MKVILVALLLLLISVFASAQKTKLPEILQPGELAVLEAAQLNAGVFRILPRERYEADMLSYNEEYSPLGIRGGGAYYSFSASSHSFDATPELGLEKGELSVGVNGFDFGMLTDLGAIPLQSVSLATPEAQAMSAYAPPADEVDARELKRKPLAVHGFSFGRREKVVVGHTYLVRAIAYDEADILVTFHVFGTAEKGAYDIIWLKIKDFPVTKFIPERTVR
ncbi:MAG: hypothetical protein ABI999_12185 [Acidobacteriota bacterium]